MKNIFKDSLTLLKFNSIFIQPILLLFILITFVYRYLTGLRGLNIQFLVLVFSLFLLSVAVQAGWFYINGLAVRNAQKKFDSNQERYQAVSETFGKFFVGVGENFLKTLAVNIFIIALFVGCSYCVYRWGFHHVGSPQVMFDILNSVSQNPDGDMMKLAQEYSTPHNAKIILYWMGSSFIVFSVLSFIFVLYNAVITLDVINPFKGLWKMITFSFQHLFALLGLFIILTLLNFAVNLLMSFSSANFIMLSFGLIFMFFYMNYYVFLIFLYYERNKAKVNSDIGSEFNREV